MPNRGISLELFKIYSKENEEIKLKSCTSNWNSFNSGQLAIAFWEGCFSIGYHD